MGKTHNIWVTGIVWNSYTNVDTNFLEVNVTKEDTTPKTNGKDRWQILQDSKRLMDSTALEFSEKNIPTFPNSFWGSRAIFSCQRMWAQRNKVTNIPNHSFSGINKYWDVGLELSN